MCTYCWCQKTVTVVDLTPSNSPPEKDKKTMLSLTENLEINIPLTFCLRFNLQDIISARCMFTGMFDNKDDKLALTLKFPQNLGNVKLNGKKFYFKIPKENGIRPFYWHHICISLNKESYWVVVNGQQWSNGTHKMKTSQNLYINKFFMGSKDKHFGLGVYNFKGELSELNIWSTTLSTNNLIDITKRCSHPKPAPDILQWLTITNTMITGDKSHQQKIRQLCSQGKTKTSYHKLIPHFQNLDGAMKTCKVLHGQLVSPKTLDEFKSWNSKNLNILFFYMLTTI